MARTRTPLVLLATLTFGVFLGVAFDRGGPFVAAQVTRPPLAGPAASPGAASPGTTAQVRSEEANYQRLARQYEQFQQVDRTFELVAKTVSPAVVHIVARKSGRNEESDRVRQYEETGSGVIVRKDRGPGPVRPDQSPRGPRGLAGPDQHLPARRARPASRPRLVRRRRRHRRAQPRPRRPPRGPARQQRRGDGRDLGPGPGEPLRADALGQPGDHQRPRPSHGRAAGRRVPGLPPDRRGDQPGEFGGAAGQHEGGGHRDQQLDRVQRRRQRRGRLQHPDQPGALDHGAARHPRARQPGGPGRHPPSRVPRSRTPWRWGSTALEAPGSTASVLALPPRRGACARATWSCGSTASTSTT